MESIHIETDLELSEITQYFRTSEVCPTLLHSSSCILIGCFACPKIVGLVDMECQNGMKFAYSFAVDFFCNHHFGPQKSIFVIKVHIFLIPT